METNPVIEKIRKLLSLANSCNEHEAALAAAHAQRLLSEHNLAMTDIDAAKHTEKAGRIETGAPKALPKWLRNLSAIVSSAFDCNSVHHPTEGKITFIGVGSDVQVAVYTFCYLERTLKKLCSAYMKQHRGNFYKQQQGLLRQSYLLGALSTINISLTGQKRVTPVTSSALVPFKEGLIKQSMKEMGVMRTVRSRSSYVNYEAFGRGQHDGSRISLRQGVERGGAPPEMIGS